MSAPPITVEAEFVAVGSFADLTNRTRSMSITRGRTDYTQPFTAGIATFVMSNNDGELDPDNTGGTYYGEILVGRRIRVTSNSASGTLARVIYEGIINDYSMSYGIKGDALVTISCVDALADLAQRKIPDGTPVVAESTGDRISHILNLAAVDYQGVTNISTGQSTCVAGTADGNALAYLERVVQTEQGALFVDREGSLRFLDRYELLKPSTLTFTDTGTGTDYQSIERLLTQLELYNQLAANRTSATAVLRNNAANQTVYGVRFLDLGEVLFATDAEVTDMLDFAMVRFTSTAPRVAQVTTLLNPKSAAAIAALVELDLADSVTVQFAPPNADPITLPCTIQTIRHQYTVGGSYRLSFGFVPRDVTSYLVLDDITLGRLDFNALAF